MTKNKSGQVTIFIIIAIAIIFGVILYLVVRQNLSRSSIPPNFQPVYNTFLSCLEEQTSLGVNLLESQAGYINIPKFEMGSSYMPFGSQLNFLGNQIPYWYYISGNNIPKEQIPTEGDMEQSLAEFVDSRIFMCNFDNYYEEGFEITLRNSTTKVDIRDGKIVVNTKLDLIISKGNDTFVLSNHNVEIPSNIYSLYNSALKIYKKEQEELFLEKYGIDILRLYAPVDGIKLSCSPIVWNAEEIFSQLKEAIQINTLALTNEEPTTREGNYYFIDAKIGNNLRFINSPEWTNSFEVLPSDGPVLIANPVGTQAGLGLLGFCYVPYHFVYNLKYPVLVQVYDGDEIFQFPLAVVIQGNQPRNSLNGTAQKIDNEFCKNMNSFTSVSVYDSDLSPVDADISYECFGTTCYIGKTNQGVLQSNFPQCVNGYIIAKAKGYQEKKYLYSSVDSGSINLILNKLYPLNINLKIGNSEYKENALIYFNSKDNSIIVPYPTQSTINLSEGDYSIFVYAYKNSQIQLQEMTTEKCVEISNTELAGFTGFTNEKCFEMTIPSQIVSHVLIGGGKENYSFSENILRNSDVIEINADPFEVPSTIEQLQNNYLSYEKSKLEIKLE